MNEQTGLRLSCGVLAGLVAAGCNAGGADPHASPRQAAVELEHAPMFGGDDLALEVSPNEGRVDLFAQFRAAPTDAEASILSYRWAFGDGATSQEAEPSHTYTSPGAYEVTLIAEIDLNHEVQGLVESAEATEAVYVTTTEWRAAELDLDLGDGWGVDSSALGCGGAVDCGPTTMRLPGAPDGVYRLAARLFHTASDTENPQPSFSVDDVEYDFVLPAGSDPGYAYEEIKTVVVSNHEIELDWDDIAGSQVTLSHIVLNPAEGYEHPDVQLRASAEEGELPLTVDFVVQSNVEIQDYAWAFGDGETSTAAAPTHTFEAPGRIEVALTFEDDAGVEGIATTFVTVKPSKTELPGLDDLEHLGFWSAGFRNDAPEFNARRRDELEALNVDYVGPYGVEYSAYVSSKSSRDAVHANLEALAENGLATGAAIVDRERWYTNDEDGQPYNEWVFAPEQGLATLASTDFDGDGISDLEGRVGWVYLGHEMGEYASRDDRAVMVELTRQFFPDTPIYPYFAGVSLAYERAGLPHPAGGLYDDYQLGPDDADIVGVAIGGPFVQGADGERVFDPARSLRRIRTEKELVTFDRPDADIWVNVNLPGEDPETTVDHMWRAEEILDYARVLLSEGGVQTLLLRAYDRWEFDLAYGTNTEDPTQEEFGFIEQREAVRWIGSWIKQTRAGRPILIIRQPEMQQTREGPDIEVLYALIGQGTDEVSSVMLQLDDRVPVQEGNLDGSVVLDDVEVGTHTLTGHLVDGAGRMIEGSEVRVLSIHVEEGPDSAESSGSGGGASTGDSPDSDDAQDDDGAPATSGSDSGGGKGPAASQGGGCGCSQRGRAGSSAGLLLLLLLGAASRRRRRRGGAARRITTPVRR